MYIPRYIEDEITKIHKTFKVLFLGGSRQVGKTTVLLHLAKKFKVNYVSLDDLAVRTLAQEDPELFLQKYSAPLFIDEVQYAPQIFSYIKLAVDKQDKKGQYWLTGSQQFSLIKNLNESLAGRIGILNLLGFSYAEEENIPKIKDVFLPDKKFAQTENIDINRLFKRILRGTFPFLIQKNAPKIETFYNSYLQTYIDRDLRDIFNITKFSSFNKFLQLCAARTGQILNMSELAKDSDISTPTAKEWLSILEVSAQIYLLRPYFKNISKRLIKAPKLYFLDTGLAAFLTKWKTSETLMNGAMAGAFFETYVVSEIIKSYIFRGEEPPIYYFRDKEGHEVDIIIERNGKIYPIEIKLSANVTKNDFKNIDYIRQRVPNAAKGTIISLSNKPYPVDRFNEVIPVGMIS